MSVAWAAWAAWTVLGVRSDARSADAALRDLRNDLDIRSLLEGDGVDALRTSADEFDDVAERLDAPLLAPLRFAPVVGRQLSAVSHQADAAALGLRAAARISDQLEGLVDDSISSGPERVAALREVEAVVTAGRSAFDDLDLGPDQALIGQIADGRARIEDARVDALDALDRAAAVSAGLARFFEGPADYLLLAANNAQMQNGQGMFLSAGVLHVAEGRMELDSMEPTSDIPRASTPVSLELDLAARWGWLDPNTDFRHLGLSHRFPVTARTAADLWVAAGRPPVDGVMVVDPFLLQVIMEASGPVDTRFKEVDAEGIVRFALHDQYQGYLSANGDDASFTAQRRDQLGDVAVGALNAFEDVESVEPEFLEHLARAAGGRHLLGWSTDAAVQTAWEAAGIDGQISPTSALLAVVNRSGNKLDWFVHTSASLTVEPVADGFDGEVRISVSNRAPAAGEPAYVVGPYPASGLDPGEYLGLVTLNLPEGASELRFDGVDPLAVAGGDGRNRTIAAWVEVARGTTAELVARFRLPEGTTTFTVEPSGRSRPTRWSAGRSRWNDAEAHTVHLSPDR